MKTIDSAVDEEEFKNIKDYFIGDMRVPYYLSNRTIEGLKEGQLDCWQFIHYSIIDANIVNTESLNVLLPLIRVLNPFVITRLKVNITPRTSEVVENGWHYDLPNDDQPKHIKDNLKSSIFYLNTNDGYTSFSDGKKIDSLENRLLIFNAMDKHQGSTCSSTNYRAVVNCVYI